MSNRCSPPPGPVSLAHGPSLGERTMTLAWRRTQPYAAASTARIPVSSSPRLSVEIPMGPRSV
eukprot:4982924-Pyramimonas_sp.AAC.1